MNLDQLHKVFSMNHPYDIEREQMIQSTRDVWMREFRASCIAIIFSKDDKILVIRRAKRQIPITTFRDETTDFNPGGSKTKSDPHAGEISFPGGGMEAGETLRQSAVRETLEEVGIHLDQSVYLGELPVIPVPRSKNKIIPCGFYVETNSDEVPLKINTSEVDEAMWIPIWPLNHLNDTYRKDQFSFQDRNYPNHVYTIVEPKIWGATGAILRNVIERIDRLQI